MNKKIILTSIIMGVLLTLACIAVDEGEDKKAGCGDGVCTEAEATDKSCTEDCTTDEGGGSVCGNGTCEAGEDSTSCVSDCSASDGTNSVCGNGTCEVGETETSCMKDCKVDEDTGPTCGDHVCDSGEVAAICPADCKFSDNGDGTVSDNTSGLVWLKCTLGQTLTSSDCSGTAVKYQYCTTDDNSCNGDTDSGILDSGPAYDACNALNGMSFGSRTNWKVATKNELLTIQKIDSEPNIDDYYFPNTMSFCYWSSSGSAGYPASAWYVRFDSGNTGYGGTKTQFMPLRCVSDR